MTEPKVEVRKLSEFRPLAVNPNRHTQRGLRALEDSVQEDGWVAPITVTADGESLDGAARLEVAADKFDDEALVIRHDGRRPVVMVRSDIADAQSDIAKRIIYNANRIAEIDLDWNLEQLLADAEALPEGLWTDAELAELLAQAGIESEPPADAEPQTDRGAELAERYGVQAGQVWGLGEFHRLAIGDCTDNAIVSALMQGKRAQAIITDPPFGVRNNEWDKFEDDLAFEQFTAKWLGIGTGLSDVIVCFMADKHVPLLRAAAAHAQIPYRRALIWRKPPGSQFAGASLDGFWFDFEIIQVFGKPKFQPCKETRMAVLEHRTVTKQEHGCEKPIGLLEDLIDGYTQRGGLVVDFFAGTGTTLMGCQRLERICYSIELECHVAAIAIQRWVDATGEEPVLLG